MGSQIDRALYPNVYGQEQGLAGAYGKRAGMASDGQSARGSAVRNFRDQTYFQRMQGQQDQAAGYGQMLSQLAMLAAYMKQRQQPSMQGEPDPNWLGGGQQTTKPVNFDFLNPRGNPTAQYPSAPRPYHEPQY